MITDLSVVGSDTVPLRADWRFGSIMKAISGTTNPKQQSEFARHWLLSFTRETRINGDELAVRPGIGSIIQDWRRRDGVDPGLPVEQWLPNLDNAPFRLLAVVNRLDLAPPEGEPVTHAGEGRFVYCAIDGNDAPLLFTVIFEFELGASSTADLRQWANRWHALGALGFGAEYNDALAEITQDFAGAFQAPHRPNGSWLRQLRTNEIALSSPWELREYRLSAVSGQLEPAPVAQTPAIGFHGTPVFADFVNERQAEILDPTSGPRIPLIWKEQRFLGGAAPTDPIDFHWNAAGIKSNDARHLTSLVTCNGCHAGETGTRFTHVSPRKAGQAAQLSTFLLGGSVKDPVDPSRSRFFADLLLRALRLQELVDGGSGPGSMSLLSAASDELDLERAGAGPSLPRRARVH